MHFTCLFITALSHYVQALGWPQGVGTSLGMDSAFPSALQRDRKEDETELLFQIMNVSQRF